jgi:hypothetical protein
MDTLTSINVFRTLAEVAITVAGGPASCTTPPLPNAGAGDRWKKFLSHVSLTSSGMGAPRTAHGLQCAEMVRWAQSRLGESRYRFFSNNCEHLSEWCVNGEHRSLQVERLLGCVRS